MKRLRPGLCAPLLGAIAFAFSASVSAQNFSDVADLWVLDNVFFDSGGFATGTLQYDPSGGAYGSYVTGVDIFGSKEASPPGIEVFFNNSIQSYSPTDTIHPTVTIAAAALSATAVEFSYFSLGTRLGLLHLEFERSLIYDPSIHKSRAIAVLPGVSFERRWLNDGTFRFEHTVTGGLVVSAVPEPQTYALLLAGLAVLGVALRRNRGRCQQAR